MRHGVLGRGGRGTGRRGVLGDIGTLERGDKGTQQYGDFCLRVPKPRVSDKEVQVKMTTMRVNPHELIVAGENSFLRLSVDEGKTMAHRTSHWRVFWSPVGPGHALFIESELTDGIKIYSDNVALARYLQRQIEYLLHKPFGDIHIPVIDAIFTREGDPRSYAAEQIESSVDSIRLVWYDFITPFNFSAEPGWNNRPLGVQTTFFPATSADLIVNGKFATGKPWSEKRGDQLSSSACLAWCETWVRPRS